MVHAKNTKPAAPQTKLNSASETNSDRDILLEVSGILTEQAKRLAASVESRLDMPIGETSVESQDNTKLLLDWVADLYSIASDIESYLNPEE